MEWPSIVTIMGKELREAQRNRWVMLLSVMFGVISLALSYLGLSGLGTFGITGFGRTAASVLNLVLLIVPLMGLLMGAVSVAGEREQGTLLTLMAQPITATEVLLGKWLGAAVALTGAVGIGFGVSGVIIARYSGWHQLNAYLGLVGLTLVLGWIHVGVGLLVSVCARRGASAIGTAVFLWLAIVLLSDLGVMGTAVVLKLTAGQLLWLALGNPAQIFKLAAVQAIQGNLELLGSCGLYAASVLGAWLLPVLSLLLAGWMIVPVGAALAVFRRRGGL